MTMYGKHHRPESIEKMRKSVPDYSGDKNPFFDKQHIGATKANISEHKKSNWQTIEYRNKRIDWLLTDEAKQISINNLPKDNKGDKNGNWKGGNTMSHKGYGWKWLKIRKAVLEKYGYKCLECGLSELEHKDLFGRGLTIHHIIPFYIIKKHDLSNLIPLCASYNSEIQALDADKKEMCSLLDTWFLPKDHRLEQLAAIS